MTTDGGSALSLAVAVVSRPTGPAEKSPPLPRATSRLAVVFPGQGAQAPGMSLDLARTYPFTAGKIMRTADRVMGFSLSRIIEKGSPELLSRTDLTQPALLTATVAAWEALRAALPGLRPLMGAGLSLGEYSALVASGAVSFEECLRLVASRGKLMEEASRGRTGGMCAVLKLGRAEVERLCARVNAADADRPNDHAAGDGISEKVWIANYNAPGQYVVTGEQEALKRVSELAAAAGAKVVPLKISGPFHSPLVTGAARRLSPLLAQAGWKEPRFPVYSNATALPHEGSSRIAEGLEIQICRSVRWEDTVRHMSLRGIDTFVEIGPGRTLSNLITRILPEKAVVVNVSDGATLQKAVKVLAPFALEVVS